MIALASIGTQLVRWGLVGNALRESTFGHHFVADEKSLLGDGSIAQTVLRLALTQDLVRYMEYFISRQGSEGSIRQMLRTSLSYGTQTNLATASPATPYNVLL